MRHFNIIIPCKADQATRDYDLAKQFQPIITTSWAHYTTHRIHSWHYIPYSGIYGAERYITSNLETTSGTSTKLRRLCGRRKPSLAYKRFCYSLTVLNVGCTRNKCRNIFQSKRNMTLQINQVVQTTFDWSKQNIISKLRQCPPMKVQVRCRKTVYIEWLTEIVQSLCNLQ